MTNLLIYWMGKKSWINSQGFCCTEGQSWASPWPRDRPGQLAMQNTKKVMGFSGRNHRNPSFEEFREKSVSFERRMIWWSLKMIWNRISSRIHPMHPIHLAQALQLTLNAVETIASMIWFRKICGEKMAGSEPKGWEVAALGLRKET